MKFNAGMYELYSIKINQTSFSKVLHNLHCINTSYSTKLLHMIKNCTLLYIPNHY